MPVLFTEYAFTLNYSMSEYLGEFPKNFTYNQRMSCRTLPSTYDSVF